MKRTDDEKKIKTLSNYFSQNTILADNSYREVLNILASTTHMINLCGGNFIRKSSKFQYIGVFLLLIISTAIMPSLAADQSFSAKDLTYVTEQYPPYNFQQYGKLQGISVDLLEKVWERMGVDLDRNVIKVVPWTEGYQRTLEENDTVLFTTFRLPEREKLFKWAGPVASGRDVLLVKRDNISIEKQED